MNNNTENSVSGEIVDRGPSALAQIMAVEIESQIATAKQYPRAISKFKDRCKSLATIDEETAVSCFYGVPRGGKTIYGPSVRLAEIVLATYGNLAAEAQVVGIDDRFVHVVGIARDLELNAAVKVPKSVRITDKKGCRYNDDMIGVTANAACSKALRDAIFRIVPRALVNSIYNECRKVAIGDASTLANRRATVLERLQKMGADLDRVLHAVGKSKIDDLTGDDVVDLIAIGVAIKDGDATVDEAFPAYDEGDDAEDQGINKTEKLAAKIKRKHGEKKAEKPVAKRQTKDAGPPSDPDFFQGMEADEQIAAEGDDLPY